MKDEHFFNICSVNEGFIRSKYCRMAGCKIFLICLILFCCIASGNFTTEDNWCYPQIPCDDRQCIDRGSWCNIRDDCKDDESDEKYCKTQSKFSLFSVDNKCDERIHFVCSNKKCVPKVLICDGLDDCGDRSDEEECVNSEDGRSESEPPAQDIVTRTKLYDGASGTSPVHAPTSMGRVNGMNRPLQAPVVDHYDTRREEDHNTHRLEYPYRHRDAAYHRESVNPSPYMSRSDTAPTYNQWTHPDSRVQNQNWDYQTSVSGQSRTRGETTRGSFSGRQLWSVIHQPRAVIHSQSQSSSVVPRNRRRHRSRPLPPFHFAENRAQDYGYRYRDEIRGAQEWLLNQRDDLSGWGEDTPRVLVALSLVTNSFPSNSTENDIMRKRLKLDLGARLLRIAEKPLSDNRIAFYINALLATCQDPRQIYGQDLVAMLYNRNHDAARRRSRPSPFVLLTLCLSNSSFSAEDLNFLKYIVHLPITGEATKDRFILATSALACVHKRGIFENELDEILSAATHKLIEQQLTDGSFGSVYSTALAAQAFFALDSNQWDENEALDFLLRFKLDDGSFGDMLSTYYILPVISGRSLVHLRNTQCERLDEDISESSAEDGLSPDQPQKNILYSLAIGLHQRNSIALHMTVPAEANFFRIMQMAQELDPRFKFQYAKTFGGIEVHTISDIPNDPERGTYWNLYVLDRRNQTVDTSKVYYGDISHLIPGDSQELLYWYLP